MTSHLPDLGATFLMLCASIYARTSLFNKRFVRPVPLIESEFSPYSSNNLFTAKPYTLCNIYIKVIYNIHQNKSL